MNGCECSWCGGSHDESNCPIVIEQKRIQKIQEGKEVAEIGIDVFARASKGLRMKIIRRLWPDLQRLVSALKNYWSIS